MDPVKITDAFGSNIIKELGIENLPDEQKLRLLEKMAEVVESRLMIRIGEALTEDGRAEFSRLMTDGDQEKVFAWLDAKGVKIDEWLVEEISKMKSELIAKADSIA